MSRSDPLTEALRDFIYEFEIGLEPIEVETAVTPDGQAFKTFEFGRYIDSGPLTDLDLIKRMRNEMLNYKMHAPHGGIVYWRKRPEFEFDHCGARVKKLICHVAIVEKQKAAA